MNKIVYISLLLIIVAGGGFSQGFEQGVITHKVNKPVAPNTHNSSARQSSKNNLLTLPFWDDFSQSRYTPDAARWQNSNDIQISATVGINNMSLNAAVFNGITASGVAHNGNEFQSGDTDILTSRMIDLSTYNTGSGIYLSFFYEKKGNGELPDDNDGLRVEFMNKDSIWVSNIWDVKGEDVNDTGNFHQVLLPVGEEQYFSDRFRFRFVATGRQTGLFDTWLVDYLYMNSGRSATDFFIEDRTFTKPITSTFNTYQSIPINHFLTNSTNYVSLVGSQYAQLDQTTLVRHYVMRAEIVFDNADTTGTLPIQELQTGNDITGDFNGLNSPFDRIEFEVETLLNVSEIPATTDYAELRYELYGDDWDDGNIGPIDLNANDTVRTTFILDDYYAYDDGSAERGAGVNEIGSQLAYRFDLPDGITDEITALDIYFPHTVRSSQVGQPLMLKVWNGSDSGPTTELIEREIAIQLVDTLNEFHRYELFDAVEVSGIFYIGWQQESADRIFVGLDKNTDSSNKIYFNTTGSWAQNDGDITGSLMIRPVFGEVKEEQVTGLGSEPLSKQVSIFPNPTQGLLYIKGSIDQLQVYNIRGQKMNASIVYGAQESQVNLAGLPKGMYVLKVGKDTKIITKKIILN